jgi:hypothetical protein
VHDLAREIGLGRLHSTGDADEQEARIATQEAAATAIDNGGLAAQVAFLVEHHSDDATPELPRGLERDEAC